jgi:hypothetical protein
VFQDFPAGLALPAVQENLEFLPVLVVLMDQLVQFVLQVLGDPEVLVDLSPQLALVYQPLP